MNKKVFRFHYRGNIKDGIDQKALESAVKQCQQRAESAVASGRLMTAALYYYGNMLFLYYEAIESPVIPEEFMNPLSPYLALWPDMEGMREWVHMYHIYYHAIPQGTEDWKRKAEPELRRGRIAFLKRENIFEYVYHHFAIVQEGLLEGDKYQSIALHEDILFSYFEEPKTMINIKRVQGIESECIKAWTAVDPEEHFIHLPGANGANFLFIPAYFAIGQ